MQIDLDTLPDDPAILQQMLRAVVHQQSELHAENDKLRRLIQRLLRHQFGRRSEQLTGDQLQFGLEDLEQRIPETPAALDAPAARSISLGAQRGPTAIMVPCLDICLATRW